jgi:hypothetical protein
LSDFGRLRWAIPEGYIPSGSVDPNNPALLSHEDACLLMASDRDAEVLITLYFKNREPVGPYRIALPARRTKHLRFNDLTQLERVPRDAPYWSERNSAVPIRRCIRWCRVCATPFPPQWRGSSQSTRGWDFPSRGGKPRAECGRGNLIAASCPGSFCSTQV